MPKLFSSTGKSIVGNSDCGNLLFLDDILQTFPETKLVIVERPVEEVIQSLDKLGDAFAEREAVYQTLEILEYAKTTYDHLRLNFHKLDIAACRALWGYVIGTKFDERRFRMLDGLRIEMIPEMKIQQLVSLH